jgi:CRISPR system Cascade subunit CasB
MMETEVTFSRESHLGQELFRWWSGLADKRGDRAQLRRASRLEDVVLSPAYQRVYRRLCAHGLAGGLPEWRQDRLAVIAGVLAHIDHAGSRRFPEDASEGDDLRVSELRFRRLLESPTMEDLFIGLRRVLPLINRRTDPVRLANDIWYWGDRVRKQWAYAYPWPINAD